MSHREYWTLLDQVATSEQERADVRRILGAGKLTEADLDRHQAERLPACRADACAQGRLPCPCPDACHVAARHISAKGAFLPVFLLLSLAAALALVARLIFGGAT